MKIRSRQVAGRLVFKVVHPTHRHVWFIIAEDLIAGEYGEETEAMVAWVLERKAPGLRRMYLRELARFRRGQPEGVRRRRARMLYASRR